MEGMILYACLCLAVFPVSIQAVATLSIVGPIVANQNVTFECAVTTYNPSYSRVWIGPPSSTTLINTGLSSDASKYDEIIEASNNRFLMIVINFASSDEGDYRCQHRFDISSILTINRENVSVYPSSPPLENLIIPTAGEEISLSFSVPGIRPAATASYNLTSSQSMQTAIVAGSAIVTNTNDAVGGTLTSTIQITVAAGTTNVGDLFTITLFVQDYSSTKQWTITGTPTTPTPSPCRCDWGWLPCDWECYYFYIIIAAVVVVVVFLLVVGVCCCCRCSDDDAEAYVCCMRKKKSRKDSVNLNENENGQKNVPRSSENGRQVNPCESGNEVTSESPCHNNPAYFESEGTDM